MIFKASLWLCTDVADWLAAEKFLPEDHPIVQSVRSNPLITAAIVPLAATNPTRFVANTGADQRITQFLGEEVIRIAKGNVNR